MLLNSHISAYTRCLAEKVCGLVRSTWGTSQGEDRLGARDKMLNTKVARRANILPHGPGAHRANIPPHVWTDQSNSAAMQDEAQDEAAVCVLCCQKRSTITVCDECKVHYCADCIDTHTCGTNVVC